MYTGRLIFVGCVGLDPVTSRHPVTFQMSSCVTWLLLRGSRDCCYAVLSFLYLSYPGTGGVFSLETGANICMGVGIWLLSKVLSMHPFGFFLFSWVND